MTSTTDARKDALLRELLEALTAMLGGDVAMQVDKAIAAIEAELSQSPAPAAPAPTSQWQISGELCEVGDIVEDQSGFRILLPNERMGRVIEVVGLLRSEVPRLPLFSNVVLSLSAAPEDTK